VGSGVCPSGFVPQKDNYILRNSVCDVRNSTNESTVSTCVMLLLSLNKCNEEKERKNYLKIYSLQQQMLEIRKNHFT